MAEPLPPASASTQLVMNSMTVMIHRLLAAYTFIGFLPATTNLLRQAPTTVWWWTSLIGGGVGLSMVGMVYLAVRSRSIAGPALAYAAFTLLAVTTGWWAFAPQPPATQPWVWWLIGPAVVCVAIARGGRAAVIYAVAASAAFGLARSEPGFGGASVRTALSEAIFAPASSLAIAFTALAMIAAGATADRLAERVYQQELREELDRRVAQERVRLDRVIHDDVMTTLTAAAHADDLVTRESARDLARQTLRRVDALDDDELRDGQISVAVLATLVFDSATRVTPLVRCENQVPRDQVWVVPIRTAEAVLGGVREAVRNSVRHSRSEEIVVVLTLREATSTLAVAVRDDGVGFRPEAVGDDRLGIRMSIREQLELIGVHCEIESAPGEGTVVVMTAPMARPVVLPPAPDRRGRPPAPKLPAEFPLGLLSVVVWCVLGSEIVLGLLNLGRLHAHGAVAAAMVVMAAATYLVLHQGAQRTLPRRPARAAAALLVTASVLMGAALPRDFWPDAAIWHLYPLALLLVVLVLRDRPVTALVVWSGTALASAWWCLQSTFGWGGLVNGMFAPTVFPLMAVLVARLLARIARRQEALRIQEAESVAESVRRFVAVVQRSLWAVDLREATRGLLHEIAEGPSALSRALKQRCLWVEATLREGLLARHVMNEQLAEVTDSARRRGIEVTLVDSRQAPVSRAVGRAVIAEIEGALTRQQVDRLVVRFAPDDTELTATVMTTDAGSANLTTINDRGERNTQDLDPR